MLLSEKIKGAKCAKFYGLSMKEGFKHGAAALKKSEAAKELKARLIIDLETAFSKRYNKEENCLSEIYQVQRLAFAFRGETIPAPCDVMLGGIFGLWTASLSSWEASDYEKDCTSPGNVLFRRSWGVSDNERCTSYSEICCQYRQMVLASINKLNDYIITKN